MNPGFFSRLLVLAAALLHCVPVYAADDKRNVAVGPSEVKRVALVIGNSNYKEAPLRNPTNDARAIAAKLEKIGFKVIRRENLTAKQIGSTLREFRSQLTPGAEALFFYAGHGLQVKGINYLPTVDADITSEEDVPSQSIQLGQLLEILDEAKTRLNLVFLDACRNNPFTRRFRAAGGGLAKLDAPSGTKISFATRPGSVAADGDGENGLYTAHLLKVMDTALPIEQALKRVYSGVKQASRGAQEPWEEGTIEGEFYFNPGAQAAQIGLGIASTSRTPEQIEDELWDAIKGSTKARVFEKYLDAYPKGRYRLQAEVKLTELSDPINPLPAPMAVLAPGGIDTAQLQGQIGQLELEMVELPTGIAMGKTQVTQGQWRAVMGHNPSFFRDCGDTCPVENVSWQDVQEFLQRLNQQTGKTYRLPTESEWLAACLAGQITAYCGGDNPNNVAWYDRNSDGKTHPVGLKQPNAWGLYDMSSNVMQWMQGCAPIGCTSRMLRGGAWNRDSRTLLSLTYSYASSNHRGDHIGFRLARTLP